MSCSLVAIYILSLECLTGRTINIKTERFSHYVIPHPRGFVLFGTWSLRLDFLPSRMKILANVFIGLLVTRHSLNLHRIQWGKYWTFPSLYTWETWVTRRSINWPNVTWLISAEVIIQSSLPSTSNQAPDSSGPWIRCGLMWFMQSCEGQKSMRLRYKVWCTGQVCTLHCRKWTRMLHGDAKGMESFKFLIISIKLCIFQPIPNKYEAQGKRMCLLYNVPSKEFLVFHFNRWVPKALLHRNSRAPSVCFITVSKVTDGLIAAKINIL